MQQYTGGIGFDIVFDTVGGANHTNSFAAVKPFGNIISTIAMVQLDLSPLHLKEVSFHVVFLVVPIAYNMDACQQGDCL